MPACRPQRIFNGIPQSVPMAAIPRCKSTVAATALDDRAAKSVVARESISHPHRLRLPELGAALDVGKEKCIGAAAATGVHSNPDSIMILALWSLTANVGSMLLPIASRKNRPSGFHADILRLGLSFVELGAPALDLLGRETFDVGVVKLPVGTG